MLNKSIKEIETLKTVGICTVHSAVEQLNYEKYSLYRASEKIYDEVILVDSRLITYKFIRGENKPRIVLDGRDITNLSTLIVRSTKGREASIALLVHSLKLCGCDIIDRTRFTSGRTSKLLTTVGRFEQGIGTDSFFAFNFDNAAHLFYELQEENRFPLLTKPIAGKKGRGIKIIPEAKVALEHAREFFSQEDEDVPLYLQSYTEFESEYRVLVVDGRALGIVQKLRQPGRVAANVAQGGRFITVNAPHVVDFVVQNVSQEGIFGVDIAIDSRGEFHIIEANRAPLWHAFEQATGINVAEAIIKRAMHRLEQTEPDL